jgi:phosphoribosyl 1,2-cyclic phosphodiesterase
MAWEWRVSTSLEHGRSFLDGPVDRRQSFLPASHEIDRVNAILISHGHYDHIHDAVALAKNFTPQVVAIEAGGYPLAISIP